MSGFNLKWFPSQAIRLGVEAKVTNFAAENGKLYVVNGVANVQLPAPSVSFHCVIKDLSGDIANNLITVVRNGVESIDGVAASFVFTSNKESISLISDGTDWFIY